MIAPEVQIRAAVSEDAVALTSLIYRSKQSNGYDDAFMVLCVDVLRITPKILTQRHALRSDPHPRNPPHCPQYLKRQTVLNDTRHDRCANR